MFQNPSAYGVGGHWVRCLQQVAMVSRPGLANLCVVPDAREHWPVPWSFCAHSSFAAGAKWHRPVLER
eukprot:14111510-Alexandrium_andersonii.AAC.1